MGVIIMKKSPDFFRGTCHFGDFWSEHTQIANLFYQLLYENSCPPESASAHTRYKLHLSQPVPILDIYENSCPPESVSAHTRYKLHTEHKHWSEKVRFLTD